jgi:hypothetical protein
MKYKIGDKVNTPRGVGEITELPINGATPCRIDYGNYSAWYAEHDLTPFKKDLTNLEVGDVVENDTYKRMVLGICGKVYLMSYHNDFENYYGNYTAKELEKYGFKLVSETPETINLLGKTYKKSDIEKALSDLEEV